MSRKSLDEEQEQSRDDTGLIVVDNGLSIVDNVNINNFENNDLNINNNDDENDTMLAQSGTNEALKQYIQKVATFPILSKEEEDKLLNLYLDKGDQRAGQAIVLSHLRLVVKIAMQYKNFGLNMMDIIAEGNIGLMMALQRFDRTKKARFSTYAGLWAKAKIQEFILKSWNMIKIGSTALRKQLLFNFSGLKKYYILMQILPIKNKVKKSLNILALQKMNTKVLFLQFLTA